MSQLSVAEELKLSPHSSTSNVLPGGLSNISPISRKRRCSKIREGLDLEPSSAVLLGASPLSSAGRDTHIDRFGSGVIEYIRGWKDQILARGMSHLDIVRRYIVWNKTPLSLLQEIDLPTLYLYIDAFYPDLIANSGRPPLETASCTSLDSSLAISGTSNQSPSSVDLGSQNIGYAGFYDPGLGSVSLPNPSVRTVAGFNPNLESVSGLNPILGSFGVPNRNSASVDWLNNNAIASALSNHSLAPLGLWNPNLPVWTAVTPNLQALNLETRTPVYTTTSNLGPSILHPLVSRTLQGP